MAYAVINRFDAAVIHSLNALSGRSAVFDDLTEFLTVNTLLQGATVISIFWYYWFRQTDAVTSQRTREHLVCTMAAGIVGIIAARVLALTLPFRVRPRYDTTLHFLMPPGVGTTELWNWSSFPSDHAVMFAALATGIFFISWRMGLLTLLYAIAIIGFPRVYLGLHYPSDIIVGGFIGALCGYCMNLPAVRTLIAGHSARWEQTSPGAFYVGLFITSFLFATMFDSLRACALAASHLGARLIAAL